MADVAISAAGAHASAAATDRIPASKGPFTPGTKGYLTNEQIRAFIIATANAWAEDQTFSKGLILSGNLTAAAWTTSGIKIREAASTLTDSSSSGTVAAAYTHKLGGNTIAASAATTFTDYFSAFLDGPIAGSNVTLANKWALGLSGGIKSSGQSLTGSQAQSLIDLATTWNTSGTPSAIKLDVTDTASAAASLLLDLRKSGTKVATISKNGVLNLYGPGAFTLDVGIGAANTLTIGSNIGFNAAGYIIGVGLALSPNVPGLADVVVERDAANIWAHRSGTSSQTTRIYRTFTNSSNYERAAIQTGSGYVELAAETAGTGTNDLDVRLTPAGAGNVRFGTHAGVTAELVTGFITIKDAGGTSRKIAVIS